MNTCNSKGKQPPAAVSTSGVKQMAWVLLLFAALIFVNLIYLNHVADQEERDTVTPPLAISQHHVQSLLHQIHEMNTLLDIERNMSDSERNDSKSQITDLLKEGQSIASSLESIKVAMRDAKKWASTSQTNYEQCLADKGKVSLLRSQCEAEKEILHNAALYRTTHHLESTDSSSSSVPAVRNESHILTENKGSIELTRTAGYNNNLHKNNNLPVDKQWLILTIPSVTHTYDNDHLISSLDSLASQLPIDAEDLFFDAVRVYVINVQALVNPKRKNNAFYSAERKYSPVIKTSRPATGTIETLPIPHQKSFYFQFFDLEELKSEDSTSTAIRNATTSSMMGSDKLGVVDAWQAQQWQSRGEGLTDIVVREILSKSIEVVKSTSATTTSSRSSESSNDTNSTGTVESKYVMLLEEDSAFCPNGLVALQYILNKATYHHKDWQGLISTGMHACMHLWVYFYNLFFMIFYIYF